MLRSRSVEPDDDAGARALVSERLARLQLRPRGGWVPETMAASAPGAGQPPAGAVSRGPDAEPVLAVRPPARWALSAPSALVVATGCLLAVIAATAFLWAGRPQLEPIPSGPISSEPQLIASGTPVPVRSGGGRDPASVGSGAPTEAEQLVVHVAGRVRRPGVVRLVAGARVVDAIQAAGGARQGTNLSTVNLARLLVDGEQVLVGEPGGGAGRIGAAGSPGAGTGAGPAGTVVGAEIDLNAASAAALESLPGIGPVLAERIIQWRTLNGSFTAVDQLTEVPGIGPRILAGLVDRVRV